MNIFNRLVLKGLGDLLGLLNRFLRFDGEIVKIHRSSAIVFGAERPYNIFAIACFYDGWEKVSYNGFFFGSFDRFY